MQALDLGALVAESLGEAQVLEDRGMEIVAQAAQIFDERGQAAAQCVQRQAPGGLRAAARQPLAGRPELEHESDEPLAYVVV